MHEIVADVAERWQDPDHPPRAEAVARTLEAPNTFTEEAVAFAVNQQMDQLRGDRLAAWAGGTRPVHPLAVGVVNRDDVPFGDLRDLLAVVLSGHRYVGTRSKGSPYLLPAFIEEVRASVPEFPARFVDEWTLFAEADAVVATGDDNVLETIAGQCRQAGLAPARCLLREPRFAVAVIDGREGEDELENLAEDALLHEGRSQRNVSVIWARAGIAPDPLLDAFAAFRGVFPVHPATPGALKMQQAFLKAAKRPHAYGEDLEFLMSKGEPEVQGPGHLRWAEYETLDDVRAWLSAHAASISLVVARGGLQAMLDVPLPLAEPGHAHRPALGEDGSERELVAFLEALGAA